MSECYARVGSGGKAGTRGVEGVTVQAWAAR